MISLSHIWFEDLCVRSFVWCHTHSFEPPGLGLIFIQPINIKMDPARDCTFA